MAASPMKSVIEQVRRAVLFSDGAGLGDGELLGCFVETRDQGAFAALVKRHGPMVWGVCRRLLSHHDAEDAFQATFLVLVRKAASVRPREMVGNWLFGVAHQTALQARRTAARRAAREVQVTVMPDAKAIPQDHWHDVQPILDRELSRLPDIYRAVIVLCDLEGRTRKEVAGQLGVPEGTVAGRLVRARVLLARRLTRSGVVFSGAALATVLADQAASANVPVSVVDSTITAANLVSTGTVAGTAVISGKVAALTEGVLKAMLMSKLKTAVAIVLVLSFLAMGATVLSYRTASARGGQPPAAEKPVKSPQNKNEAAEKPDRKTDKESLQGTWRVVTMVTDGMPNVKEHPDEEADAVVAGDTMALVAQPAGKKFFEFTFKLDETTKPRAIDLTVAEGRGKGGVAHAIYELEGDSLKLCFPQNQEGARPTEFSSKVGARQVLFTMRRQKPKNEADKDKEKNEEEEPLTAWGKEVGGLQAGLGYDVAQKRACNLGDTVRLVIRVRNVSKETIKFAYLPQFLVEQPPAVTDGQRKLLRLPDRMVSARVHQPVQVNLAPGKQVELYDPKFKLLPASEKGADNQLGDADYTLFGAEKFQIQYKQVIGRSSAGPAPDASLNTLATGNFELDVWADPPAPGAEKDAPPKQEKEPLTAWGKEADGLQAGLGFRPGQKRVYHLGETASLVVRVRNVTKQNVSFQYLYKHFIRTPPAVIDGEGKPLPLPGITTFGVDVPQKVELPAGKEIELYELKLTLRSNVERERDKLTDFDGRLSTLYGVGKFQIQYEQLATPDIDPILGRLATGKFELEVKADPPPAPAPKNDFPNGWGGGGGNDYEIRVDKSVRHAGKASGSIRSIATTPTWYGALTQAFDGAKYQGKRLRMTAYVKSKDVENSCGMWMRMESYDGKGHYTVSSDLGGKSIKGTNDWKQDEIVMDIPNEGTTLIYFGAVLVGKGQVWVDDFKFEVVGNDVKTTGRVGEARKATSEPPKGFTQEPKNLDFEE
jgi:RNA polymerase sigma factor (sigma-70 family)